MHTRHATLAASTLPIVFMLNAGALAQCPPQRLTSPSDFAGDFGFAVAMNDRHLLVGDWRDHTLCGDPFCANGYAWAYERDADGWWSLIQRLEPADIGWSYGFGRAIALDGDRAIITRTLGPSCGGVPYLFEFDGERWVETGRLCPPPGRGGVGSEVALRGDLALVRGADENVLVYSDNGSGWVLRRDLVSPDSPTVGSAFGVAFDLDDRWVVVGAATERLTATFGGAAYVFRRLPDGHLEFAQKLTAPDIRAGPQFGNAVALEGNTLIVGGHISDRQFDEQGAVYVYALVDGRWELRQEITHADPAPLDRFGVGLALEGDTLLVGASQDASPTSDGTVYLFRRGPDQVWRQHAALLPDLPARGYAFVSQLAGSAAAIGARDSSVGGKPIGSVDIFDLSCYLCPPDLDADGALTVFDFLTLLNLFQDADPLADFDGDGELTIFDFLAFQTAFDAGCG